jgi:hypothetical protein
MTSKVSFYTDEQENEFAIIDRGNGEFTSMPKAVWDELEAAKENGTMSDSV